MVAEAALVEAAQRGRGDNGIRCDTMVPADAVLAPATILATIDCATATDAELEKLRPQPVTWSLPAAGG